MKPLKGIETGIEGSLRTFFELDYPEFELIFCVAEPEDPVVRVVGKLVREYPRVCARIHIGAADKGPNPKVNNLIPGYELARHDHILISDSNVRVWPEYLHRVQEAMGSGVGVVTAVVAGRDGLGIGGNLEAVYLNTFVARWMHLAHAVGYPCVIGKTMFFRRSVLERVGGLKSFARYVAEDHMAGQAMRRLGFRVEVMREPVSQHIGNHSFAAFWARHLRWGRIRRSQSLPGFCLEPFQYALGAGLVGSWGFSQAFSVAPLHFLTVHCLLWALADLSLIRGLMGRLATASVLAWILREVLALPHWLHMAWNNKICWRGHRLEIMEGGLVRT